MTYDKKVIIYLYNRFFDPLIQGNFWLYIDDYLKDPDNSIRFHLVTYEDDRFPLTLEQSAKVEQWQQQGLEWTRLKWHPGTSLTNKFIDVWSGLLAFVSLRRKGYRHIVSLASVAGSYAYIYCSLLGMKLFMYQFEPHSEYAIDNGMWAKNSLQYKIAHFLERRAAEFATVIASGTRFMQERLEKEWRVDANFFKIATVANDKKFTFNQELRDSIRERLGLQSDQWVLFYPGKFGSLYYYEETAWMYRWLRKLEPRLHFLIVTPHDDAEIFAIFDKAGVERGTYSICHSDYADIHSYYFAADFAVIAVPPGPSKKFISNIKVGEYLCAGLPFLITRGVSEDYIYAEEKKVGVVVNDFHEQDIKAAWPQIRGYLEMNPDERRVYCREVGLDYRGFESLNPVFKAGVSSLINS
ncbi:Glycosyltransferase subfamily 4-like N-terminal domain-containing protein [Candidatus Electrothrix aarhusensis]